MEKDLLTLPAQTPSAHGRGAEGVWKVLLIVPLVTVSSALGEERGPKYLSSFFAADAQNPAPNQFPKGHGWKAQNIITVSGVEYYVLNLPCDCPNCTTIANELLTHPDVEAF